MVRGLRLPAASERAGLELVIDFVIDTPLTSPTTAWHQSKTRNETVLRCKNIRVRADFTRLDIPGNILSLVLVDLARRRWNDEVRELAIADGYVVVDGDADAGYVLTKRKSGWRRFFF